MNSASITSPPLFFGTYYWKVQIGNSVSNVNQFRYCSFTPPTLSPTLVSPASGSINRFPNDVLIWTAMNFETACGVESKYMIFLSQSSNPTFFDYVDSSENSYTYVGERERDRERESESESERVRVCVCVCVCVTVF